MEDSVDICVDAHPGKLVSSSGWAELGEAMVITFVGTSFGGISRSWTGRERTGGVTSVASWGIPSSSSNDDDVGDDDDDGWFMF